MPFDEESRRFIQNHDDESIRAWVFTNCNHVVRDGPPVDNNCSKCKKPGPQMRLHFGMEPSFWREAEPIATGYFPTCGHVITGDAGLFWSKLQIVQNNRGPICPFCFTKLATTNPYRPLLQ